MSKRIDRLIKRAGLTIDMVEKGKRDHYFEEILDGLEMVHRGKEVLYGRYLEIHGSDPQMFALMEHFADLKRKYVRAEHFMKHSMEGVEIDILELYDTYTDMAVYAAMGVQLIEHLMERENAPDKSS